MSTKKGGMVEPNPRALFILGETTINSAYRPNTTNPKWNENFCMFVESPENEKLICKLEDEKSKSTIGALEVMLDELLKDEALTIDRNFEVKSFTPGVNAIINLKLSLLVNHCHFSIKKNFNI